MVYEEESGEISMAFTGDSLISRRLDMYREERFLELASLLRGADVSFTNSETLFHRFEGIPVPDSGAYGTYAQCDPEVIAELKWLGIDMVSTANNHCYNYGDIGILTNLAYLDEFGMPHAGTGPSLTEAVAPAYLDTPKGSVALIGVTITMPNLDHRAGDARGPIKARPGANVLRKATTNVVPTSFFEELRVAASALGAGPVVADDATELRFAGQRFARGEEYRRDVVVNDHDLELNLRWVREARRMAEWVVVSMHCHEGGASADEPAAIAEMFAKACIDAGADAVFGHGPHRDRGIEIYKGKPIMYSLATLFLHNEIIKWQPNDMFERIGLQATATPSDAYDLRTRNDTRIDPLQFKSTVVEARYEGHELSALTLHPIDLGFETHNRRMRGRPVIAEGPVANEILDRMVRLSEPFGTVIGIVDGRGVVKIA